MREGSLLSDLGYLSFLSSSDPPQGGKESTVYIHTHGTHQQIMRQGRCASCTTSLCLCKRVKELFLGAHPAFHRESGCKGTAKINTRQIFRQLFSHIERIFNTLLTKIKDKGKKKGELIII